MQLKSSKCRMSNLFIAVTIVTVMIFFVTCEKDPFIGYGCGDLDDLKEWGYIIDKDSITYFSPCYNPNNNNEFVFIEKSDSDYISKLCTFNMLTKEKVLLADYPSYHPQWGKNNWIVFNRFNSQIWKVKSNGDSLTMLFSEGTNYNLVVNPEGNTFAFKNQIENEAKMLVSGINGIVADTLPTPIFNSASWSKDNDRISVVRSGFAYIIGYYNSNFTLFTELYDNEGKTGEAWDYISDTEWFPDSKNILWLASGKYWVTSIDTKNTYVFYEPCENNYNMYPSFSPDGTNIIWEKTVSQVLDNGNILKQTSSIVMTDIHGENEITILPTPN